MATASRRRGRTVRNAVLALLVAVLVAVALYSADRPAVELIERRVAARVQTSLGTVDPPAVTIERFPFLTQLLTRKFASVHVVGDGLGVVTNQRPQIAHADLRLSDVRATDSYRTLTAERVEGTAQLDYAALATLAGVPVSYAGDGRVELQLQTTVLSLPVKATVTGTPRVDVATQTVTITEPSMKVSGVEIPAVTARALLATVLKPVPLTGIPLGLTVTALSAGDTYLGVALSGADVVVSG